MDQTLQKNLIKRLCVGVVEGGHENFLLGLGGAEQKRLRTPALATRFALLKPLNVGKHTDQRLINPNFRVISGFLPLK